MPSWLNQHRKADLVELAEKAGLTGVTDKTKTELVALIDDTLQKHAPHFANNATFTEYYSRRLSPIKREPAAGASATINSDGEIKSVVRARGKLPTQSKRDTEAELSEPRSSPTSNLARRLAQTPARPRDEELTVPNTSRSTFMPPSPAVVTDVIEEQTARIEEGLSDLWDSTHITDLLYQLRVELSSMTGVQMSIFALEGYFLQRRLMPWNYAFDIPASLILGTHSFPVFLPDLFVLLTGYWWSTTITWAIMNFWFPAVVGWFYNLSLKLKRKDGVEIWKPKYRIDPLIFSITKAVLNWLVYNHALRFGGLVGDDTVNRIVDSMPVGYNGIMVGAYIGIVVSIWDAVQGKKGWI